MRVIHLARKPLVGSVASNVLEHGAGAINVDASRVSFTSEADEAESKTKNQHGDFGSGPMKNRIFGEFKEDRDNWNPTGRWPANLVLEHRPGCRRAGTLPAPGYTINRWSDGAKPFGGGAGHPYEGTRMGGGEEEVWLCGPDCPVADLNEQSGITRSAVAKEVKISEVKGTFVHNPASIPGVNQHGGSGGASRFFKTVGGS